jgi:hypothetical protein
MSTLTANHQLADGNDNAAGLTAFPSITDANSVPFVMPRFKGSRNRGVKRVRLDGTQGIIGYDRGVWFFTGMTLAQYDLLKDTYEGLVTVKIPLEASTYANFNAILIVPDESGLEYAKAVSSQVWDNQQWPGYSDVEITLRKLEAL